MQESEEADMQEMGIAGQDCKVQDTAVTLGPTVPHLVVRKNPSTAITRNCAAVTRLPIPGSWRTSNSRKMTLQQQLRRTTEMARRRRGDQPKRWGDCWGEIDL